MKDFLKGLLAIALVGASWGVSAGVGYMTGVRLTNVIVDNIEEKMKNNKDTNNENKESK